MKLILIYLLFFVGLIAADATWESYKAKHGKKYSGKQDVNRRANFMKTNSLIKQHNERFKKGLETYAMAHNIFSDMSPKERARRLGVRTVPGSNNGNLKSVKPPKRAIPATYDLRGDKCIGPIKNQGQCGNCWAFSATAPIEYQKCKKTGTYVSLSEQQVTDCTYAASYEGCGGGSVPTAWNYLYKAGGEEKTTAYPFTSGSTGKDTPCKFAATQVYAKLANAGSQVANSLNETVIQQALVTYGPLSHYYYVSNSFYSYKTGIFSDSSCPKSTVNHAMTLVGYGVNGTTPYWISRNQWGTNWGEAGYVFIKRGTNECAFANYIFFPTVV